MTDVLALAEKHGGAGFLEFMDNDQNDTSTTASINQNLLEHVEALIEEAEAILA